MTRYRYSNAVGSDGWWKVVEHRPDGDRVVGRGKGRLALKWSLLWNRRLRPYIIQEADD